MSLKVNGKEVHPINWLWAAPVFVAALFFSVGLWVWGFFSFMLWLTH